MSKRSRADVLLLNLPQLQNKIKRDPSSYTEEFSQQWRQFEFMLSAFLEKPQDSDAADEFAEHILFISHVAHCYPKMTKGYAEKLMDALSNHYSIMAPTIRQTMVKALILMRNRNLIEPMKILGLFFTLFRCKDKTLREMLQNHIVNDIKNINAKSKNNSLNKTLQNFMYTMLKDISEIAARKSLDVMMELYKKNVWNDSKTVNVIAEACLSTIPKIATPAIHFFLGSNEQNNDDESDDDDVPDVMSMRHANQINKKKKSRRNMIEKARATVKRKERARNRAEQFNFSALHLINDPQGFAEKLFSRLRQSATKNMFRFELRLEMMNLVSRLIGVHKLILLGFYEFVISYLKPHQREVTRILAFVAQSSHDLVPPDALELVVRAIADNFVWSNCAAEVVTVGLNGLREICARAPLAMPEELLQSLIDDFKKHREKGPVNAARSLLCLYREINPEMLRKKDRGRVASINMKSFKAKQYGEIDVLEDIDGADMLEEDEDASDDDEAPELVQADSTTEDIESLSGEDEDQEEEVVEDGDEEYSDLEEIDGEEIEFESDDENEEDEEDDDDENEESDDDEQDEDENEDESSPKPAKKPKLGVMAQKILTDEDFARIREHRLEREAERLAGIKTSSRAPVADEGAARDFVDVSQIMSGTRKKNSYQERMDSIMAGREGREFGSRKGKKERTSLTNKAKAKKKAFIMIVHKREVRGKAKRSLYDKQKALRAHIKKQKMRN